MEIGGTESNGYKYKKVLGGKFNLRINGELFTDRIDTPTEKLNLEPLDIAIDFASEEDRLAFAQWSEGVRLRDWGFN